MSTPSGYHHDSPAFPGGGGPLRRHRTPPLVLLDEVTGHPGRITRREVSVIEQSQAPTLGAVVDALGVGVIRVVSALAGLEVLAGEPVVHDPVAEPSVHPHELVLAVGVDPALRSAVDMVTRCGELGACAVLLRTDEPLPPTLLRAADAAGIALLAAPKDAAWGQLHTLLRTARSASSARVEGRASLGDLFGLADAVSSLVGGAVTVEDEHSVVLAYSSTAHPVDDARRDTILGRRVPPEWIARLHGQGVFRRLWSSDDVVRVELEGAADRLAVAVRAGGEILGSIWVQEGERPLGAEAETALREAAAMAALHLLRARSGEDLKRRQTGDQLLGVLEERLPATLLAPALRVSSDDPVVVIGIEVLEGGDEAGTVVLDRAADLLVLSCRAFRRRVVAAASAGPLYAVLPAPAGGAKEARQLAADLAQRVATGLRVQVRSCVADQPLGLVRLAASRTEVDLGLRVLAERSVCAQVHLDDIRAATVLVQLRDVAALSPGLLEGKVRVLQASDGDRSTAYIQTLRGFLDCFGDVRLAAEAAGVHPNTFRYRLRRLIELAQLDLDDPAERLVAHLQLHLIDG